MLKAKIVVEEFGTHYVALCINTGAVVKMHRRIAYGPLKATGFSKTEAVNTLVRTLKEMHGCDNFVVLDPDFMEGGKEET